MLISELIGHLDEFLTKHGDVRVILHWEGTEHDVPEPNDPGRWPGMFVHSDESGSALMIDAER